MARLERTDAHDTLRFSCTPQVLHLIRLERPQALRDQHLQQARWTVEQYSDSDRDLCRAIHY
jgi:hypothetical protein